MNISEIMSQVSSMQSPTTELTNIVKDMHEKSHSCALIGEHNAISGIITERDLVKTLATLLNGNDTLLDNNLVAADIMTPNPICLEQDTPLIEALTISRVRQLRHIPVVDKHQQVIGLVTRTDMIDAYLKIIGETEALEAQNKALQLIALEDPLMTIGNRRAMEVDLKYTQAASKREQTEYSVALLDVDMFKKYNDHYGHQQGDEALQAVAEAIQKTIRDSDRVYRYGGEEILVLMPNTDEAGALLTTTRVLAAIEKLALPHELSPFGVLTISAGVNTSRGGDWKDSIKVADKALYQAKESGRNCVKTSAH